MKTRFKTMFAIVIAVIMVSAIAVGCGKKKEKWPAVTDRTPVTDTRTMNFTTFDSADNELKNYASLYQAIDELNREGNDGDYVKNTTDNTVIFTNAPNSASDLFYFYESSSYLKHGPWKESFAQEIQDNPRTHTINAKDGKLNYSRYSLESNKGVNSCAAWIFSKASPANVIIQPVLYSGITKAEFKAELTKAKIAPSFNKDQKTYARVGFLSQQGYVVADMGIACDTSTGRWYLYTGTRGMEDDEITLGVPVMDSTWNDTEKCFVPNNDVSIMIDQIVNDKKQEVTVTVTPIGRDKVYSQTLQHDKLEAAGTLAINASLNPDIATKGNSAYDIMNGSYIKNLRIVDAKGYVKAGLTDVDYDGNSPVLTEGEHDLYTLSAANSYTVMYNDDNSSHAVLDKVDTINLDFAKASTPSLSMIPIDKVVAKIEALPSPNKVMIKDTAAIESAQEDFNKLTKAQQDKISTELIEKLDECGKALTSIPSIFTAYTKGGVMIGKWYGLYAAIDEIFVKLDKYIDGGATLVGTEGAYIENTDGEKVFKFGSGFYMYDKNYTSLGEQGWSADYSVGGVKNPYSTAFSVPGNMAIVAQSNRTNSGSITKRGFNAIKHAGLTLDNASAGSDLESQMNNLWGAFRNRSNANRITFAQAHSWADTSYSHKSMTQVYKLTDSKIMPSLNPLQSNIAQIYSGYAYANTGFTKDVGIYLDSSKVNVGGKAEWKFMSSSTEVSKTTTWDFTDEVVATATKNDKGEFVTDYDLKLVTEYIYGDAGTSALKLTVTRLGKDGVPVADNPTSTYTKLMGNNIPADSGKSYDYGISFTPDTWTNNRKTPDITNGGYFKNAILMESTILNKDDGIVDMMYANPNGHQQISTTYGEPNVSIKHTGGTDPVTFNFDYSIRAAKEGMSRDDAEKFEKEFAALELTAEKIEQLTLADANIADIKAANTSYFNLPKESKIYLKADTITLADALQVKLTALDNSALAVAFDLKTEALELTVEKINTLTLKDTNIETYKAIIAEYQTLSAPVLELVKEENKTLLNALKTKVETLIANAAAAATFETKFETLALTTEIIEAITLEDVKIADYRVILADYAALSADVKALVKEANITLLDALKAKIEALDLSALTAAAAAFDTKFETLALTSEIVEAITLEDAKIAEYRAILTDYAALPTEVKALIKAENATMADALKVKIETLDAAII